MALGHPRSVARLPTGLGSVDILDAFMDSFSMSVKASMTSFSISQAAHAPRGVGFAPFPVPHHPTVEKREVQKCSEHLKV